MNQTPPVERSGRQYLRDLSIRHKLIVITMVTSSAALLLACASFAIYEFATYRAKFTRELTTIAQMVSASNAAALTFGDRRAAQETLSVLKGEPDIALACLYDPAGSLFAEYPPAANRCAPKPQTPGARFGSSYLDLSQPIVIDGEALGSFFIRSDLREMYERLTQYGGIVLVVLLCSSGTAFLISSRLQQLISQPMLALADVADRVSAQGDYTLRAAKEGQDEVGLLVDRFNGMMSQIQDRDGDLQKAQEFLEVRVRQRTQELQYEILERQQVENDLRASKLAAEQANRAKSAFLANMSHELRTPLNAIIGYSEMLEEDAEVAHNAMAVADLKKIRGAGRHLLALIEDVLDLSKIEAGRMTLQVEAFPVRQMVEEARVTAEPLARKNRNQLLVKFEDQGDLILADALKFRQSLFNLLSNACKFTECGTVTLEVERRAAEGKEWMLWHVRDTGIGIAQENLPRLFQSFSQVDGSATRKFGGTGLGLSISQRFCQMMGGDITVESQVGQGSTFTIKIPSPVRVAPEPMAGSQTGPFELERQEVS